MKFSYRNAKRGFTLIELIVVTALIAILATLIIVNVGKYRIKARDRARVADIDHIRIALEQYKLACGEYPEKLDSRTDNGCAYGQRFSDFLPHIPIAPHYGEDSRYVGDSGDDFYDSQIDGGNTYLYAGLSNTPGGKCYDYHIGAILESGSQNRFLKLDHDAQTGKEPYKFTCRHSHRDFGSSDSNRVDDAYGLYDFRSQSSYATN